jgi:diguanylate cyclase (GGDEF)-like protein/PAS domain S-box-containing protein
MIDRNSYENAVQLAADTGLFVAWRYDFCTRRFELTSNCDTPTWCAPQQEFSLECLLSWIHPEDSPLVQDAWKAYLDGETKGFISLHRMKSKDGQWRWFRNAGQIVESDASGQSTVMAGTLQALVSGVPYLQEIHDSRHSMGWVQKNAGIGLFWQTRANEIIYTTPLTRTFLELPSDQELFGIDELLSHISSEDADKVAAFKEAMLNEGVPDKKEFRVVSDLGEIRWIEVAGGTVYGHRATATIRDITMQMNALNAMADVTQEMQQTQDRLLLMQEVGKIGQWWETSEDEIHLTEMARDIYGFSEDQRLVDWDGCASIIHPVDVERITQARESLRSTQDPYVKEYRVIRPVDGKTAWVRETASVYGREEPFRVTGMAIDITEQKESEFELEHLTSQLQMCMSVAGIMTFTYNFIHDEYEYQGHIPGIMIESPEEKLGRENTVARIHPDDIEEYLLNWQRHLDGETDSYASTVRLADNEGGWRWVRVSGRVTMRDEEGNPLEILGVVQDISVQKHAEEEQEKHRAELAEANRRLEELAKTDVLTGLNNRRYFESDLHSRCAETTRYHTPLTCMMIDIDHFKSINDTFGHDVGDQVLREIARAIQDQVRNVDIAARFGGEEFVVLMPQTPLDGASILADRLCERIANTTFESIPDGRQMTISIGVCCAGRKLGIDGQSLVKAADSAMYESKRNGRNQVTIVSL